MAQTIDAPVTASPEKASLFEDFIDIFYAPSKVFARRANSGFWAVTLILTVVIGALVFANSGAMDSITDAEFQRQATKMMEKNPQLTMEQIEQGRGIGEMMAKVGGFVFMPIAVLLLGLAVWLVGKMFGAALGYTAGAMIAAYSYIPRILENVLVGLQGMLLDTSALTSRTQLTFGVTRFMDADTTSAGMLALLSRLDLFTIWVTILLGIGISVVGKIPREKGMIAAAVLWVVGTLPALLAFMQ
ncbi:MAG: YIP1 family protein [Gemmatimonadaceae bacterium]